MRESSNPKKAELKSLPPSFPSQLQTMQDLDHRQGKPDYGFEEFEYDRLARTSKEVFTMFYSYEIRAGVDCQGGNQVHDDTRTISITLPRPRCNPCRWIPTRCASEGSLFNGNEVTDTAEALKHAKKSAADKASKSQLLQEADKQAKQIVEKAYSPIAKTDG